MTYTLVIGNFFYCNLNVKVTFMEQNYPVSVIMQYQFKNLIELMYLFNVRFQCLLHLIVELCKLHYVYTYICTFVCLSTQNFHMVTSLCV